MTPPRRISETHRQELLALGCVEPGTELTITDDAPPERHWLKPAPPPDGDGERFVTRAELRAELATLRTELAVLASALVAIERRLSA